MTTSRLPVRPIAALILAAVLGITVAGPAQGSVDPRQWPLDSAHFDASRIWPLSTGAGVTVAVVDSGVAATDPDLTGRLEPGADFTGTAAGGTVDTSPDSHGTSIASLIAGSGRAGVSGLAPQATILPIRVTDDTEVTPTALAEGITYAIDHHAQVINISMGMPVDDPQVRAAVEYAVQHGIVVVAAVGNDGTSGNAPQYPAALPGVLAVAGSRRDGSPWAMSEHGSYVSLAAPAEDIYLTDSDGGHSSGSGTSYAAPYVSAAAALLRSRYPDESAGQIISRLIDTATRPKTAPGTDAAEIGHGIVDPYAALTAAIPDATGNPLLQATAVTATRPAGGGHGIPRWPYPVAGAVLVAACSLWWAVKNRKGNKSR